MKALLFLTGSLVAIPLWAQVTVPPAAVTAPSTPVTAPTGTPNLSAQPGALINSAVPTAVPPQSAGRTFQTPFFGGPPAPVAPQTGTLTPGFPPVVAPGTLSTDSLTNFGLPVPFTNIA